jgi:hypothetical protein
MPMKCTLAIKIIFVRSLLYVLDEYDNDENEADQHSKIDAWFAQQVWRHPVH